MRTPGPGFPRHHIDRFLAIGARHGVKILEDAACAIGSRYKDRPIGGHLLTETVSDSGYTNAPLTRRLPDLP
jgi:dTDP-4-amino-4,6-dideoxygalactose transaminase